MTKPAANSADMVPAAVLAHVGLKVNVATMTTAAYWRKLRDQFNRTTESELRKEVNGTAANRAKAGE